MSLSLSGRKLSRGKLSASHLHHLLVESREKHLSRDWLLEAAAQVEHVSNSLRWEARNILCSIFFICIGPIFRSGHECLLRDCVGDHQGQLLLPSQEEG